MIFKSKTASLSTYTQRRLCLNASHYTPKKIICQPFFYFFCEHSSKTFGNLSFHLDKMQIQEYNDWQMSKDVRFGTDKYLRRNERLSFLYFSEKKESI